MCAFEGNNCLCCCLDVVIVGPFLLLTLPFFIVHFPFAFCILHSFSLCLYHCCIVRQCLGTPYQCLIGPSYNFCCWALDDQRIPLFFQQEIDPHSYHPAPSIITYELLCNSPAGVIVGTLRNSFYMSDFLR